MLLLYSLSVRLTNIFSISIFLSDFEFPLVELLISCLTAKEDFLFQQHASQQNTTINKLSEYEQNKYSFKRNSNTNGNYETHTL